MKKLLIITLFAQIYTLQFLAAQNTDLQLFNRIDSAFNSEDFELIIEKKSEILKHAEIIGDTVSAEMLYYLGDAYLAFDSLTASLEIMEKEAELRKKIPNTDPVLIADILFNLAYYQQLNDQFEPAKQNIMAAGEIYKKNLGIENPAYVESKKDLARIHGILGEHRKSIAILEQLLKLDYVKNEYQHIINKELGMAYFDIGYYSKSEDILKSNLDFIKKNFGKESVEYAEGLVTLAIPFYYRSQYSEAELLYNQALDISSKLSRDKLLEENTKNNLALLYWKIGLYDDAINIFEKILNEDETLNNAITFNNYAQNLIEVGNKDSAIHYFNKSLNIIELHLGKNSELYTRFLKEKAIALYKSDDLENYYKLMNESFNNSQTILEKSNPEYSKYELNWGIANFRMNDIKKAELHIKAAHDLRAKYLSKKHPLYAESSKEMAELKWYQDNPKKAKSYFEETFKNYFAQIEAYFPALSEQQKANFYTNTLRSTFEEYNSFAIAYREKDQSLLGDMYNYQLATKGLIMYATAKARKNIFNSDDEDLKTKYQSWINTKELIAQLYSMSEDEVTQQDVN